MAREYEIIHKEIKDADGVTCYIKTGEIVRCKDCKYFGIENVDVVYGMKNMVCLRHWDWANENTKVEPNDFCSRGERKDNG